MANKGVQASALVAAIMVLAGCGGSSGQGATAASCSNAAESQGVFKDHVLVGVVGDFTGPTVGSQGPYLHGIGTYLKFANDHDGICGKSIQATEVDDKYTSNLGQAAYKQFTDQSPAYFMFGNNNSSVQDALQEQVRSGDLPIMAQSTTLNSLNPFNRNFYQVIETYPLQAQLNLAYYNQNLANGQKAKAVCFTLAVASGAEYCNAVEKFVIADGGTLLKKFVIPSNAVDATPEAIQIQALSPNVVFMHFASNGAIVALKAFSKIGLTKLPMVGTFGVTNESVFQTAPKDTGLNLTGGHAFTPAYIATPGSTEMLAAAKKYGVDSTEAQNINFVVGWVAGKVFVAGAKAGAKSAGKVDHNSLRAGLNSLSNFDTGGQSVNFQYSATDHQGIRTMRPYKYDYAKNELAPVGSYPDWAKYLKP
jgi:branched-chain amino acid transport system substrate-binding protein